MSYNKKGYYTLCHLNINFMKLNLEKLYGMQLNGYNIVT